MLFPALLALLLLQVISAAVASRSLRPSTTGPAMWQRVPASVLSLLLVPKCCIRALTAKGCLLAKTT
jgi:hypothetical protein